MKKLLTLLLTLALLACLAACAPEEDPTTEAQKKPSQSQNGTQKPEGPKPTANPAATDPNHKHDYQQEMTPPTCTEEGYITYSCICGDSYKYTCAKPLGHTYEPIVTAPTCTAGGYTTYTCACGDSYVDDETGPMHSYNDKGLCTLCSKKVSLGLEYTKSNNYSPYYTVSGIGSCRDIDIIIPESYEGLPVTGIGSSAFSGEKNFRSIVIPESVTSIGESAFHDCTSLTSITIPDSVTVIDYSAFEGCTKLTKITFTGTKEQWKAIDKRGSYAYSWNYNTGKYTIYCTDGEIKKGE